MQLFRALSSSWPRRSVSTLPLLPMIMRTDEVWMGISGDMKRDNTGRFPYESSTCLLIPSPPFCRGKYLAQITITPCEIDLISVILSKWQKSRRTSRALLSRPSWWVSGSTGSTVNAGLDWGSWTFSCRSFSGIFLLSGPDSSPCRSCLPSCGLQSVHLLKKVPIVSSVSCFMFLTRKQLSTIKEKNVFIMINSNIWWSNSFSFSIYFSVIYINAILFFFSSNQKYPCACSPHALLESSENPDSTLVAFLKCPLTVL